MKIKYSKADGSLEHIELTDKALTVGRSPDADIAILDERASRMHCGIRLWDGEYYVKDLQSKNGTYLNNEKVEMSKLAPGDKIRIGKTVLTVEDESAPGPDTLMHNVEEAVEEGKGYDTILREIVDDVEQQASTARSAVEGASEEEANKNPVSAKPAGKKSVKMLKAKKPTGPKTEVSPKNDGGAPKLKFDKKPSTSLKVGGVKKRATQFNIKKEK